MEKNIKYLIIGIISIIVVVAVGTYAWLSYRTNDTAMILTIGDIENVQITLSPYQINASISPQTTYTTSTYTTVNAINNNPSERSFRLYYKIDTIDSELATSDFKYTIERSTDSTTYSHYKTGNFYGATNNSELTILDESIPGNNTTYKYKVYIWLDGTNTPQGNAVNKTFIGELRAEMSSYVITFDAQGGTIPSGAYWTGSGNSATKIVTENGTYGNLPEPTRTGYVFKGWNGKNILNIDVPMSLPSNTAYSNATLRTFTPNTYVKGLAYNNYYQPSNIGSLTLSTNMIQMNAKSGYGVAFPLISEPNKEYAISFDIGTGNRGYSLLFYQSDGTLINYSQGSLSGEQVARTFTTPNNTYYLVIEYYGSNIDTNIVITNIQLEEGSTVTAYEPYYITDTTTVVQSKDHTLTAIWEPIIVTFDANGGIIPSGTDWTGSGNTATKELGSQTYGNLPEPTRIGYTFLGWNGKNLINIGDKNVVITNSYYKDYTSTPAFILSTNTTYTFSFNYTINSSTKNIFASVGYGATAFQKDIKSSSSYTGTGRLILDFTTPDTFTTTPAKFYTRPVRMSSAGDANVDISNIQLEEGSTATAYEPYYITKNTTVVQNKNHTLTAIWQEN